MWKLNCASDIISTGGTSKNRINKEPIKVNHRIAFFCSEIWKPGK
jgi:hypothetical protein